MDRVGIKCEIISLLIIKDYKGSSFEITVDQAGCFIRKIKQPDLEGGHRTGDLGVRGHNGQRGFWVARPTTRMLGGQRPASCIIKNYTGRETRLHLPMERWHFGAMGSERHREGLHVPRQRRLR